MLTGRRRERLAMGIFLPMLLFLITAYCVHAENDIPCYSILPPPELQMPFGLAVFGLDA